MTGGMDRRSYRGTLLNIELIEERYGSSALASLAIHLAVVLLLFVLPYVLPRPNPIRLGTGPGGGSGGETYTVGVVDELAGGVGMTKPSLVPQPPALAAEKAVKEAPKQEAVPLPNTVSPKKPARKAEQTATKKEAPKSNVVPTAPELGAGGTGGVAGGSGGGVGGGIGVSIGSGSGGLGDSWYARAVETRISSNWVRPAVEGIRFEVVYSFYIAGDGSIYDIKKETSSGNVEIDLTAERAIRASNPLAPPPPEFRGRPVQFVAQFANAPN
jgi:TonB family protein